MLIQCTKSLLDKIGIKGSELAPSDGHEQFPNSFFAWQANFITINRRKAIVLMNNETRYPVVIYRPNTKDLAKIKELIQESIAEALRIEGVGKEVIEDYLDKAGDISFSKTANRSMVAKMNHAVRDVEFNYEYLDENTKIQRYISLVAGRFIQLDGENGGFYPNEKLIERLATIYGGEKTTTQKVIDVDLYQLKISLNLEGHDIWRRVLVPSTYSFRHLHYVIQTVFDWQNYHLHSFDVEGEDKPIQIVMDDDPETLSYLDFDRFDIGQERFVSLADIFPKYHEVNYEYDFGDGWEHTISFEKVEKSTELRAIYVEGSGERPPEDVGGQGGFEYYLEIIGDENHPEHASMKMWAEGQKERQLSRDMINKRLSHVTRAGGYSTFVYGIV